MSRSFKKNGILKGGRTYKGRSYNKKFRCRNKQQVRMGKDPYQMKELVNQYDVWDFRSHFKEESFRNARSYRFTEEEIKIWKRKYFQK
jgi:hypothetical protein